MDTKFIFKWLASYLIGLFMSLIIFLVLMPCMIISAVGSGGLGIWIFSRLIFVPFGFAVTIAQTRLFSNHPRFNFTWVAYSTAACLFAGIIGLSIPDLFHIDAISSTAWYIYLFSVAIFVGFAQWIAFRPNLKSLPWIVVNIAACIAADFISGFIGWLSNLYNQTHPSATTSESIIFIFIAEGIGIVVFLLSYALITALGYILVLKPQESAWSATIL